MKYGIIATVVDAPHITGVERYIVELVRNFKAHYDEIVVLCHPSGVELFRNMGDNLRVEVSPFSSRILTDQLWIPWKVRQLELRHIYNASLGYPLIGFGDIPFTIMLHDATPWRFPETISKGMKYYYFPLIKKQLSSPNMKAVVTNSVSSMEDISVYAGVNKDIIHPIYLGVDHLMELTDTIMDPANGRYILTVGTLEPRKNIVTVLSAFEIISKEWPEIRLVIVGRTGWLEELKIPDPLKQRVVLTGYIEDSELENLYRAATMFVMPSLYEGFGFPVVEAMRYGVPVLAARTSSLPEIGGDACEYAEPLSVDDFSQKMKLILSDNQLRLKMSVSSLNRSKNFSWNETARRTWDILNK